MTTAGEAKNGIIPLEDQKMGIGSSATSPGSITTASTAAAAKETVVTAKVSNGTVTNVTIVQTSDADMLLSPIIPPAAVSATAEPLLSTSFVNMEGSSSVCSICRHESDNEEEETLLDCTVGEDDVVKNVSTQTPMPTTATAPAVVTSMV